ncbi:hypothetical protein [Mucilaginibacter aquaedulcis]|uniref:hypothetical protein n=1 Tax=Mucilaginibacter aquaedulcis TaxID=1187081 RepID=UPI0025B2C175|nr:hypothetical protein [Mucilaginibacter aquaedulcis]MDN3549603.1 hypothetical protein [Mucilaginibacter aquaedulcis]
MKNFELKNLGVQEMNATEMTSTNGGGFGDIQVNINLEPVFKMLADVLTNVVSGLGKLLQGL